MPKRLVRLTCRTVAAYELAFELGHSLTKTKHFVKQHRVHRSYSNTMDKQMLAALTAKVDEAEPGFQAFSDRMDIMYANVDEEKHLDQTDRGDGHAGQQGECADKRR